VLVLIIAFSPDELATQPAPLEDWSLLALWGIAIAGLLIAWRREMAGAAITFVALCLREVAWVLLKGRWLVNFLLVWALLLPPAILFVLARRQDPPPPPQSDLQKTHLPGPGALEGVVQTDC